MKVRELLDLLRGIDPEATVVVWEGPSKPTFHVQRTLWIEKGYVSLAVGPPTQTPSGVA